MSRIKDIKNKTKLSLDEMFETKAETSVEPTGKLDNQLDGNPKKQKARQQSNTPVRQIEDSMVMKREISSHEDLGDQQQATTQGQLSQINTPKPIVEQPLWRDEHQRQESSANYSAQRYSPAPVQTFKMTFNLTESFYKAFNDIYAKRLLQGRKTEKSELICQAIALLVKAEEEREGLN